MFDAMYKIAENKIAEAMENGEFDNLTGKGRPLNFDKLKYVPPELRAGYNVLKNAGFLPVEMDLRQEICSLGSLLAGCPEGEQRKQLNKKLTEKKVRYNILLERRDKRR